jgi:NCS1 family nucleobase:cation symporter-1
VALVALAAGVAPCVPGFLTTIKVADFGAMWTDLYSYAWFVSFGVAFLVYVAAMSFRKPLAA